MQYVINKIDDFLYRCTNIKELKQRLKFYERIKTDCEKIIYPKIQVEVISYIKNKNKPSRNDIR